MRRRSARATLVGLLAGSLVLTACVPVMPAEVAIGAEGYSSTETMLTSLGDPSLLRHLESSVEAGLVDGGGTQDQQVFVENVEAVYYSKEYLEELTHNSQANIYFGYTLAELEEQFEGARYVFAPDDQGKTVAKRFDEYDDTFDQVIRNVTIGSGVVLLLVTASAVAPTAGAPAAVSVIVAVSAKSASILAGSDAFLSGAIAGVMAGVQTGDLEQSLKEAGLSASEGLMWGAIGGALLGGGGSLMRLRGAAKGGLTINQAAHAQLQGFPRAAIKMMRNGEEVMIYERAGLKGGCDFRGNRHLLRDVDFNYKGPDGLTNRQRMAKRRAPLDPRTNQPYELHHIGQKDDSPLAIVTRAEHTGGNNDSILHPNKTASEVNRAAWGKRRGDFWEDFAAYEAAGLLAKCLA